MFCVSKFFIKHEAIYRPQRVKKPVDCSPTLDFLNLQSPGNEKNDQLQTCEQPLPHNQSVPSKKPPVIAARDTIAIKSVGTTATVSQKSSSKGLATPLSPWSPSLPIINCIINSVYFRGRCYRSPVASAGRRVCFRPDEREAKPPKAIRPETSG